MIFNIKYKEIRYDAERDVYIFDTQHPQTGEDIHTEQPITSSVAYDAIKSQIDTHIAEIDTSMNTPVEVNITTPFQVSVTKKRIVAGEHTYNEEMTIG